MERQAAILASSLSAFGIGPAGTESPLIYRQDPSLGSLVLTFDPSAPILGRMSTQGPIALLQGTLDLLVLRTLAGGKLHGQGIARAIHQASQTALVVEHNSLYPALQRLEERGWITAEWGTSSNNRRARFYELTRAGRRQLVRERDEWWRFADAITLVLGPRVPQEG